jgi:hypothetical protein
VGLGVRARVTHGRAGGVRLSAREVGGGKGSRLRGRTGPGKEKLGCMEKKERRSWAGPRGGKKKGREKGQVGLGRKEEKREGKRKERVGRAQLEKEGEKELHSNAFEFELEI